MKRYLFILILLIANTAYEAEAQENRKTDSLAVMQIIEDIFDGMRAGDSSMIGRHLLPEVVMHTVGISSEGQHKIFTESSANAWLQAVAKPKEQVWDERTTNYKLNLTEGLATVWMDYSFFVDDQMSHCGVNSFQLVKNMGNWKIIYIIDTRKRTGCNISAFMDTNK